MQRPAALCALASLLYAPLAGAETRYERVVEKVANMVDDENAMGRIFLTSSGFFK